MARAVTTPNMKGTDAITRCRSYAGPSNATSRRCSICSHGGASGLEPLISHRFELEHASQAYETLLTDPRALGILFNYGVAIDPIVPPPATVSVRPDTTATAPMTAAAVSVIGAGSYARRFLLPALRASRATLHTLVSSGSALSGWSARRSGFARHSTDASGAISDPAVNAVVIATRHDSHAGLACEALAAGKHVFVEKPLALTEADLSAVEAAYAAACSRGAAPVFMVGFNRRFAPLTLALKDALARLPGPRCMVYTVNAGELPPEHWIQEPLVGGGRIVGEVCHFIDLLRCLAAAPIVGVEALAVPAARGGLSESVSVSLRFADHSIGTVHYFANGARSFPKERIEVFAAGRTLRLNNFRKLESFGAASSAPWLPRRQDKGNQACIGAFMAAVKGGLPGPMSSAEIFEVSRITLRAAELATAGSG